MTGQLSVDLLQPLETRSGIARYRQIADQLAALLVEAGPGTRLPSEHEIARHLGVSRATAIQSLRDLKDRGLVARVQGSGTFSVEAHPAVRRAAHGRLPSFSEDLRRAGRRTAEQLVRFGREPIDRTVAARLQLDADAEAWVVERVITSDGHPVVHATSWLSTAVYPVLDPRGIEAHSLYEELERTYGDTARPASADETWAAVAAPRSTAQLLAVPVSSPVMRVDRLASLRDGRPAEHAVSFVRSETFVVSLHVSAIAEEAKAPRLITVAGA